MSIIKDFSINGEYITLSQFLKEENYISSGGQAKWYLKDHPVILNGQSENRRGKKIHRGDNLIVADVQYTFR